ncbi:hypothetical protein HJC23_010061 [Cyclotella cryptica]|uniref:Uncharacterized protein n=1 Tax=Cyclotella cryptica TaxID=29204 RepID=A0ABD3Q2F0_9STRA|eukprot:CCRYP_009029-RA/>CCRYP_009029-RA protein AED:0.02 eAED:0.02 QI:0/-1/0/1/-1/1/1/0/212
MPCVAANSRIKRLLSSVPPTSEYSHPKKKRTRVRFDDNIQVFGRESEDEPESLSVGDIDDDDVEFLLSVGEGGQIDDNFTTKEFAARKHHNLTNLIGQPMSPIEGCYICFADELCSSDDEDKFVEDDLIAAENTFLKISIDATNGASSSTPPMAPLITPPASPRRVHSVSVNGVEEEVTICEWPCNLAVDIAITAASLDPEMFAPSLDHRSD